MTLQLRPRPLTPLENKTFVAVNTMPDLSPAAQAVLDAAMQYEINPECYSREIAAAALRAAADQVIPPDADYASNEVLMIALNVRHQFLAIAAELEAQ